MFVIRSGTSYSLNYVRYNIVQFYMCIDEGKFYEAF